MYASKPAANSPTPSTLRAAWVCRLALPLLVALACSATVIVAEGPPGPRKPAEQGRPAFQNGGPGQGHGFAGFGGMRPGQGMEGLTDEEKQRLRAAVEKVWSTPEMIAARDKIMKANEELRSTLREALKKTDPDVVAIMEKVKVPMPWEQHRLPPPLPRPDDPDFPRQATNRLGFEMMSFAKPEQREALRHLHERVVELPEVKQAITRLQEAPKEGRGEAFKNLREVYKHECEKAIAEYRRKRATDPTKGETLAAPKS